MEALKERGIIRDNAPHLVHDLAFVVPNYAWWETPFYGIGMKVYDMLAFRYGFGKSRLLSKSEVLARIPTLEEQGLRGGVLYYDAQFDDSRLLINLAQTAQSTGGRAAELRPRHRAQSRSPTGFINGLSFDDLETDEIHSVAAKVVVNATGPFSDNVRRMDDPAAPAMIAPSQGSSPGAGRLVSARRLRHHGAAHQRRARDVRHPLARPRAAGHDRHASRPSSSGARRAGT